MDWVGAGVGSRVRVARPFPFSSAERRGGESMAELSSSPTGLEVVGRWVRWSFFFYGRVSTYW